MSTRVKVVQPECPGIARKMTRKLRPLLLCGTRPEAIKLAPVIRECRHRTNEVEPVLCLTGQHREMLRQVTDYFDISADIDLELMRPNQTLAELTGHCLQRVDEVIAPSPRTASLLRRYDYRAVRIDSGLLSEGPVCPCRGRPANRRPDGPMARGIQPSGHKPDDGANCAPTKRAAQALLAEGIHPKQVRVTGNTVIDALLWARRRETARRRWRASTRGSTIGLWF